MTGRYLHTVLILSALAIVTARAQETSPNPVWVGPTAGFAYGLDQAEVPVFSGSGDCGLFTSGRTLVPSIGGTMNLPSFFTSDIGLTASVGLSYASGRLNASPIDQIWIVHPDTREAVQIQKEYRLNATSLTASLDLLAGFGLSDRFTVAVGPFVGYRLSSSLSQTDYILEPESFRLDNGHREGPTVGALNPEGSSLSLGPSFSATYSLPLGERRRLVPGVSFRADLLSSIETYSWQSYQAGISMSLLFDVTPVATPPQPEAPPIPELEPEPPAPLLLASLELYGVDKEENRLSSAIIHVYETLFQRHAPIVPAVFFERDANIPADRYSRLEREQAGNFSAADLSETEVLEMQQHVLNIIGSRLREKKESTIALVGSVSEDEPAELARARAEGIRSYLTKVWGIEESRVKIREGRSVMQRSSEESEDGRSDNRRVEMESADPSLLAPVVTTEIVRDFDPPLIRLMPKFEAEAGVAEWSLVVSQGEHAVVTYGSSRGDKTDKMMDTWRIDHDKIDTALSPLVATLRVQDSTGAVVTADATLPMTMMLTPRVVDQRVERSGDRERLVATLVGFDFSSAQLGTQNARALEGVADAVKDGASITLTGYTDRIGDEGRNNKLAEERAANAAAVLQSLLKERDVKGVTLNVSGLGVETERFDNDLPEGRVLSRGVGVVVEQTEGGGSKP